ncbi:hypothetical protein GCM10010245_50550 [Streptomyces spectabilis]|nr:hypothetical protein GCM10010245_50550 [Streptomyces spectabilis]
MAGGEPVKGAAQRGAIQVAAQSQGHAGVVLRAALAEVVEEPQPLLRAGQGQGPVARGGRYRLRRGGGGRVADERGEGGDGPRGEHVPHRETDAQFLGDPRQRPGGEDGVAAEVEEVVVGAHGVDSEDLPPDGGQCFFPGGARLGPPLGGLADGGGQGAVVHLVVAGEREFVQDDDGGRDHVGGQDGGCRRAQRRGLRGAACVGGCDVADEPSPSRLVLAHHHDGLAHAGQAQERRLDLAGFDAEAAHLDLAVDAAEELELAFGVAAAAVAGAVEAGAGRAEGVGDEAGRGQSWAAVVAAGHAVPADVQLAVGAGLDRSHRRVEHVHLGAGQRGADARCAAARGEGSGPGGDDRRFGGAVGVDHPAAGGPAVDEGRRAGLGSHDQRAQMAPDVAARRVGQGGEGGGRDQGVGDAVLFQDGGEFVAEPRSVRGHHQGGAGQDGAAQFEDGGVEAG